MQILAANFITLEDRFVKLFNDDHMIAAANAWWDQLMTEKAGEGKKSVYQFLLSTAQVVDLDEGQYEYGNLITQAFECTNRNRGVTGLKLTRNQIEDDDFSFASDWAAQAGSATALDAQYLAIELLANAEAQGSYDGVPYFSASHPVHPNNAAQGVYSNLITANPLTLTNFGVAMARMKSFKMPNGTVRNLRPSLLVAGPAKEREALEITDAAFISATSNVIATANGVKPLIIPDITDDSWYLVAQSQQAGSGLNPFIYQTRESFKMTSYSGATDAELCRSDKFEWIVRGRSAACYGHPYQMIKNKAS